MYKILTLNNISAQGTARLDKSMFEVASEFSNPDAILVRSAKMHGLELGSNLRAIGRAGAGVNNIPVNEMSKKGIAVFNAPGANANAVKELTIAGMLLAARNIPQGISYTKSLNLDGTELDKAVEQGKKMYAGYELPSKTLGIVGLGAIGLEVANAAVSLGMRVVGYDPSVTVTNAWKLNANVERALSVETLFSQADIVTFHVPLIEETRHSLNSDRLKLLKKGCAILNFARNGVVCDAAIAEGLDAGIISCYVTDFPNADLILRDNVISLPHLGASTEEAEENCAVMVAEQISDYLRKGNISNSVNFPSINMPVEPDTQRLAVVHDNSPGMLEKVSHEIAEEGLNIVNLVNRSRGDLAYTLVAVSGTMVDGVAGRLAMVKGMRSTRLCL